MRSTNKPGDAFLGMVHRLDRPCSGVIAFAKTSKCAMRLSEALRDRSVDLKKEYLCVVNGVIERSGTCHHWLQVDRFKTEVWETSSHPGGKRVLEAKLRYFPLAYKKRCKPWTEKRLGRQLGDGEMIANKREGGSDSSGDFWKFGQHNMTLLRVELETGRKHQIRSQLSYIGHSIVGDGKYGAPQAVRDIPLHSHMLEFPHPTRGYSMSFYSYPPDSWLPRFGETIWRGVHKLFPVNEDLTDEWGCLEKSL